MAGDELHALADELVGNGDRLLGITGVVTDGQRELLTQHPAFGINVSDGHLSAALHLFTEGSVLTGHRTSRGYQNLRRSGVGADGRGSRRQANCEKSFDHYFPPKASPGEAKNRGPTGRCARPSGWPENLSQAGPTARASGARTRPPGAAS